MLIIFIKLSPQVYYEFKIIIHLDSKELNFISINSSKEKHWGIKHRGAFLVYFFVMNGSLISIVYLYIIKLRLVIVFFLCYTVKTGLLLSEIKLIQIVVYNRLKIQAQVYKAIQIFFILDCIMPFFIQLTVSEGVRWRQLSAIYFYLFFLISNPFLFFFSL